MLATLFQRNSEPCRLPTETEAEIAENYGPRILYFALSRLRDRSLAEDVTQQTVMIVIQAWRADRLRDKSKLVSFSFGVAKRLILKRLRERTRQDQLFTNIDSDAPKSWQSDPEAELFLREERDLVREALSGLSEDDHNLLHLCFVEGESLEKIAQSLGISCESVRQRKSRAMKRLRSVVLHTRKGTNASLRLESPTLAHSEET